VRFWLSNCKDFRLRSTPELEPFEELRCVHRTEVGFLVLDPTWVVSEYDHAISFQDWECIGSPDPLARQVFVIATIGQSLKSSTANFLAPLIINPEQALGRQVILSHSDFTVDQALAVWKSLSFSLAAHKTQYLTH
jgi:flagellar assembly factor FliW